MINGARRALYKKFRLEGYSGVASALRAGYSRATANNGRLHARAGLGLKKALELSGLDDLSLAETCCEGLRAELQSGHPDWANRHKYLNTVLTVRGDIGESKSSAVNVEKLNVVVMLPPSDAVKTLDSQ